MRYSFLRFPGFLSKALTLSYDDGVSADKKLIEMLDKYNVKCTFNISAGRFGKGTIMPKDEAVEVYKDTVHEVAAHGFSHTALAESGKTVAAKEVLDDRLALEEIFDTLVTGMAYAGGSYDDSAVEALKACGINYARTGEETESFFMPEDWLRLKGTCHHNNKRLMDLAQEFLDIKDVAYPWHNIPRLFYLWGHSYEFDNDNNWDVMDEFLKLMSGRDDIWYATNGEIFNYTKAYERLEFGADAKRIYNPSAVDVYINYLHKDILIPAGETVKVIL